MALGGGTKAAAGRGIGGFLGRSVTESQAKRFQVSGPKRGGDEDDPALVLKDRKLGRCLRAWQGKMLT